MSKSNAYILILCDHCGNEEEMEAPDSAGKGYNFDRYVQDKLGDWEWIAQGDLDFCCEYCRDEYERTKDD